MCLFSPGLGGSPMLLCQAYLSVVNLESRSGQDTGLDLAQGLADLVHGLVHYHDGGTCGPFQPAMLAVSAAQHAVYQAPAVSASTHSLVYVCQPMCQAPAMSASTCSLVVCVSCGFLSPCPIRVSTHLFIRSWVYASPVSVQTSGVMQNTFVVYNGLCIAVYFLACKKDCTTGCSPLQ